MLRRTARKLEGLEAEVRRALATPTYQRVCPPSFYVTYDPRHSSEACRHSTRLLDLADCGAAAVPHTSGIYVLSSTSEADFSFRQPSTATMIGLPAVPTESDARRFVDHFRGELEGLRTVALTHMHPYDAVTLRVLRERFPGLRVLLSAFGKAFLTDATFYGAVGKVVASNRHSIGRAPVEFAGFSADDAGLIVPDDGAAVALTDAAGRHLRAVYAHNELERRQAHRGLPPHYEDRALFFLDSVFQSLHIGSQAVCRVPWLSQVAPEISREAMLPVPSLLCLRDGSQAGAMGSSVLLSRAYDVSAAAEDLARTLAAVPETEQVLTNTYGELPGDPDEIIAGLRDTAERLEGLRSRLAARLATDTARNVPKWSALLLTKIVREVLFRNTAATPTPPALLASLQEWAEEEPLGDLAACLTQAALALPPTSAAPAKRSSSDSNATGEAQGDGELEGPNGVQLLLRILEKKGLRGLGRAAERESVDLASFVKMSPAELRRVFKTTVGVNRRLEDLQEELKAKTRSL